MNETTDVQMKLQAQGKCLTVHAITHRRNKTGLL